MEFNPSCDRCGSHEHSLTVPGEYLCSDCAQEYIAQQFVEEGVMEDVEEEYIQMVG